LYQAPQTYITVKGTPFFLLIFCSLF